MYAFNLMTKAWKMSNTMNFGWIMVEIGIFQIWAKFVIPNWFKWTYDYAKTIYGFNMIKKWAKNVDFEELGSSY